MSENGEVPQYPMPNKPPVKTSQIGCWIGWIGPLVAILPLVMGFVGSLTCPQPANEGNCAAAAAPWLMFLSIPFGFILGLVGLVIFIVGKTSEKKQNK